jgi:hypothetical protein
MREAVRDNKKTKSKEMARSGRGLTGSVVPKSGDEDNANDNVWTKNAGYISVNPYNLELPT